MLLQTFIFGVKFLGGGGGDIPGLPLYESLAITPVAINTNVDKDVLNLCSKRCQIYAFGKITKCI